MLRRSLIALSVLLGGPACGSSTPATPPPSVPDKRPETSSVLFVVVYEALLPIACHDAKKHVWASGVKCIDMVPNDGFVRLESGRRAKITGKREPTIDGCTLESHLYIFEDEKLEKPGSFAVWPDSDIDKPHRISWEATKKGTEGLSDHEKARFGGVASKALGADSLKVLQVASADLDGDGTSELFVSATSSGFDPTAGQGSSGLFAFRKADDAFKTIRTSKMGPHRVEGTVDLNGDGTRELWFSERRFHPGGSKTDAMILVRPTGGGGSFEIVADVETCWPKPKG